MCLASAIFWEPKSKPMANALMCNYRLINDFRRQQEQMWLDRHWHLSSVKAVEVLMDLVFKTIVLCVRSVRHIADIWSYRIFRLTDDRHMCLGSTVPSAWGVTSSVELGQSERYDTAHPNIYMNEFSFVRCPLATQQRTKESTPYKSQRIISRNPLKAKMKLLYQLSKQILSPTNKRSYLEYALLPSL